MMQCIQASTAAPLGPGLGHIGSFPHDGKLGKTTEPNETGPHMVVVGLPPAHGWGTRLTLVVALAQQAGHHDLGYSLIVDCMKGAAVQRFQRAGAE